MNPCNNKPKNKKVATKQDIPVVQATKQDIPVVQERNDSFDSDDEDIDFLQDINTTFLERRKINELGVGETYVMEHLERITTKYGPSLLATLNDDEGDRFKVFLPKRFNIKFTDKRIKYVNKNTLHLKYLGGDYNDLEFRKDCLAGRGLKVVVD